MFSPLFLLFLYIEKITAMGIYIYTLRKKMVEATVLGENKTVKVGLIKYFAKEYSDIYETPHLKRECARVSKMISNGFKPDFYAPHLEDGFIYKFPGFGIFEDTPDFGELCGKISKKGKQYVIVLMKEGEDFRVFYERTKNI